MSEEAAAAASRTDSNDAEKHRAEEKANYARAGNGFNKNPHDKQKFKRNFNSNGDCKNDRRDNRNGKKKDKFQNTKRKFVNRDNDGDSDDVGKEINCFNCGGRGHMARDCPTPKVDDGNRRVKPRK